MCHIRQGSDCIIVLVIFCFSPLIVVNYSAVCRLRSNWRRAEQSVVKYGGTEDRQRRHLSTAGMQTCVEYSTSQNYVCQSGMHGAAFFCFGAGRGGAEEKNFGAGPIRKSFKCILQGVRFLMANQTRLSGTSDNESYISFLSQQMNAIHNPF